MGVPDETYFGESPSGGGLNYGQVRAITNDDEKITVLKKRLDVLLIEQNQKIAERDENSKPKIWSPFSLCVLTLLGIETLGRIICDLEKIKSENEQSKKIVTPIYRLLDNRLSDKPTKKFKEAFEKIHGDKASDKIKHYSDIFHKYQRNTFNHGFQAKGVFIDTNFTSDSFWILEENKGFLIVNPYLFWDRFVFVYNEIFKNISTSKNKDWRSNCLTYFDKLLI